MIAGNLLDEMDAETFHLIGTDACGQRRARFVSVDREEGFTQWTHFHQRGFGRLEQHFAGAHDANRRMERMLPAAEPAELLERLRAIARLCEHAVAERQR